ncbi:Uncharacterized protein APZ42_011236 [Daphnia magna]|uniref:Uncharacterized protein n=1 Tax=Daphnia magna TaxID=35525 RepID=A0A162SI22_9CRUS|nr:Uncharacterized protein APZ42_011236 [Daphnia magna]
MCFPCFFFVAGRKGKTSINVTSRTGVSKRSKNKKKKGGRSISTV